MICMACISGAPSGAAGDSVGSLDQISKGRAFWAFASAVGMKVRCRAFGVKSEERVGRLTEGIKLIRQIWSDEEVNHRGKYYTLEGYSIVPKPVQKPCPIWIAVSSGPRAVGDKGRRSQR